MNIYIVSFSRTRYGRVEIEAQNEQEARNKFNAMDYDTDSENIKGGEAYVQEVELY